MCLNPPVYIVEARSSMCVCTANTIMHFKIKYRAAVHGPLTTALTPPMPASAGTKNTPGHTQRPVMNAGKQSAPASSETEKTPSSAALVARAPCQKLPSLKACCGLAPAHLPPFFAMFASEAQRCSPLRCQSAPQCVLSDERCMGNLCCRKFCKQSRWAPLLWLQGYPSSC